MADKDITVITQRDYKNVKALRMENSKLSLTILPAQGGKTVSIYHKLKDFELLYVNTSENVSSNQLGNSFSEGDACGFDDAFPSIDEGLVVIDDNKYHYPDHGEIWTAPMNAYVVTTEEDEEQQEIVLSYGSRILPYHYEKRISLKEETVTYHYHIINTGDFDFPCLWAFHCLVHYEEDMQLIYPAETKEFFNAMYSPQLKEEGLIYSIDNGNYDFHRVPAIDSKTMVKYYLQNDVSEGRCGYHYPSKGVTCNIIYDETKLPYLGFWITAGGYRGEYNCALEPANGFYDSIAKAMEHNKCFTLKKGESLDFDIHMSLTTSSIEKG
ncbi:MAG: Uncharacterized protein K0S76_1971 [Herbinix sp.]|jgi:galactose mutarotase-like enzyme|nr:Uncharacterized protein [Herbinix sp.]